MAQLFESILMAIAAFPVLRPVAIPVPAIIVRLVTL